MRTTIQLFLAIQAAVFAVAAAAHYGLYGDFEDSGAATPETVIGLVLLAGLVLTFVLPSNARLIAITAQGFALLGTLLGATLVIAGIGPRTAFDITLHAVMLALLATGLWLTWRVPEDRASPA